MLQLEEIREQFKSLDVDCDGEISLDDLKKSMKGVVSDSDLLKIFEDTYSPFDEDLSGFHCKYRIR
ncbi:unnamed protein product [Heterosigma akashiwo]